MEHLWQTAWLFLYKCLRRWQCSHQNNSCCFMLPDGELLGVVRKRL